MKQLVVKNDGLVVLRCFCLQEVGGVVKIDDIVEGVGDAAANDCA